MESHDHEPSYYEVALTNRQVVGGFVILLACLFVAFLSGVWLGRGGAEGAPQAVATVANRAPEAGEGKLEQLTFFGDRVAEPVRRPAAAAPPPPAATARTPERAAPTPAEIEAEKLRRTLETEMAQHRTDVDAEAAGGAASPAAQTVAPVGTRLRRKGEREAAAPAAAPPPAPVTAPVAAATAVTAGATSAPIWIQVYSSTHGAKAQDLATRLRKSAFQVAVLEAPASGAVTYRVRVGPYATRDEADRAAARLRRDFRLDTWVTDQP